MELMALFARALNDLGRFLDERFGGSFAAPVAAAAGSATRLVRILAEMPSFRDVSRYDELSVPFYKRAQLTAADLALAFGGEGPGRFTDLDRLTIFADNLVPHVLRVDGLLRYDETLAARIDRRGTAGGWLTGGGGDPGLRAARGGAAGGGAAAGGAADERDAARLSALEPGARGRSTRRGPDTGRDRSTTEFAAWGPKVQAEPTMPFGG